MNLEANQLFSLKGKTALLTGASGFLGRTFARALLANGARVVALGRSDRLNREAAQWSAEFGSDRVRTCQVDMQDRDALEKAFDQIVASESCVEILVNNAHELGAATGFNTPEGLLDSATPEQLMRQSGRRLALAGACRAKVRRSDENAAAREHYQHCDDVRAGGPQSAALRGNSRA